jgi:putative transcriptional regulator
VSVLIFRNSLRERRERAGLSREALALASGVSRSTISAIERRQLEPRAGTMRQLAQFFECRVEDLFWSEQAEAVAV